MSNKKSLEALDLARSCLDFEIKDPMWCRTPAQKERDNQHHNVHTTHDVWPDTMPYLHSNTEHKVASEPDNLF